MHRQSATSIPPFFRADQDTVLALLSAGSSVACSLAALLPRGAHAPTGIDLVVGVANAGLAAAILRWKLGSKPPLQASVLVLMALEISVLMTMTHSQIGLASDLFTLPWIGIYAACFASKRSFLVIAAIMTLSVAVSAQLSQVADPWFTTLRFLMVTWCAGLALRLIVRALERRAETDGLTEILNRTGFFHFALAKGAQRSSHKTFVALIDLDGFKSINDQQGHVEGDEILRRTANILKQELPGGTILARIGGDEFAIIAFESRSDALLERLKGIQSKVPCSFSFGIAPWCDSRTLDSTMAQADKALYINKRNHQRRLQETPTERKSV